MPRYKLWDKQEDIYTIGRDAATGRMHWTAQEYIEDFAPWAAMPTAKPVVGGGLVNGTFFDDLSNLKAFCERNGAEFDPNLTDAQLLAAIEDFEDQMNAPSDEPSAEERIAAALEYQTVASLPDEA